MRSFIDFSSWQGFLGTIISLLVMTLLMIGIRLVFMQTIQRKRERENRQINERLRTLIAAYKTLGGSFTGDLTVDPRHKREQDAVQAAAPQAVRSELDLVEELQDHEWGPVPDTIAERRRRTRDAVEAALSDIILLGTEEQVRLAAKAAQDMVDGRPVRLAALVHSLRPLSDRHCTWKIFRPMCGCPIRGRYVRAVARVAVALVPERAMPVAVEVVVQAARQPAVVPAWAWGWPWAAARTAEASARQQGAHALQVFRRIDTGTGCIGRDVHGNAVAVPERTQLLQRFAGLDRGLR